MKSGNIVWNWVVLSFGFKKVTHCSQECDFLSWTESPAVVVEICWRTPLFLIIPCLWGLWAVQPPFWCYRVCLCPRTKASVCGRRYWSFDSCIVPKTLDSRYRRSAVNNSRPSSEWFRRQLCLFLQFVPDTFTLWQLRDRREVFSVRI